MAIHSSILAWKNPMDRGAWWVIVHRVAESDTSEHSIQTKRMQVSFRQRQILWFDSVIILS